MDPQSIDEVLADIFEMLLSDDNRSGNESQTQITSAAGSKIDIPASNIPANDLFKW
jgi:hypothetical protein